MRFTFLSTTIATLIVSASTLGTIQAQDNRSQDRSTVVAEINGNPVTLSQLEADRADSLFTARRQYYQAERKALDEVVDQRLLDAAAGKEHVTVDQLIQEHVNARIGKDPTDDQLQLFYDVMGTDKPFETVRPEILREIRDIRLKKARADYLKSLREQAKISILLPEPRAEIDFAGKIMRGPQNAPVRVIEFADYQCPYCRQLEPQLERLKAEFGDKVALVFMDFPLPMHAHAQQLAEAADCAAAQGKFWEYHDFLFKDLKDPFQAGVLKQEAKDLHLDSARFDTCLDSEGQAAEIKKDVAVGKGLGITGTPTIYVNGRFESGAIKYEVLRDMVEQELSASSSQPRQSASR